MVQILGHAATLMSPTRHLEKPVVVRVFVTSSTHFHDVNEDMQDYAAGKALL